MTSCSLRSDDEALSVDDTVVTDDAEPADAVEADDEPAVAEEEVGSDGYGASEDASESEEAALCRFLSTYQAVVVLDADISEDQVQAVTAEVEGSPFVEGYRYLDRDAVSAESASLFADDVLQGRSGEDVPPMLVLILAEEAASEVSQAVFAEFEIVRGISSAMAAPPAC